MKTINKFDFNNKKAIVRVDFNVPIEKENVTRRITIASFISS